MVNGIILLFSAHTVTGVVKNYRADKKDNLINLSSFGDISIIIYMCPWAIIIIISTDYKQRNVSVVIIYTNCLEWFHNNYTDHQPPIVPPMEHTALIPLLCWWLTGAYATMYVQPSSSTSTVPIEWRRGLDGVSWWTAAAAAIRI